MSPYASTEEFILALFRNYPCLQLQDLLKALHQSVFGCGHLVSSPETILEGILTEQHQLSSASSDIQMLDGDFCRVPLQYLSLSGLKAETLARLFFLSAQSPHGSKKEIEEKLQCLLSLAEKNSFPFSVQEVSDAISHWQQDGYPACRHSQTYHEAYAPAYRVIRREYLRLLPLLAAIDALSARKAQVIVAIEGGSAAGKSTLAELLRHIYRCNVFHMDDFFLQPHQRTPERYAQPGGNVDWERFLQEILLPLHCGETVFYRPFDCQTLSISSETDISPLPLNIVEGAYSMHPELEQYYDLSVFLSVSPEVQKERILTRNEPWLQELFFTRWIPLEQQYFNATDPCGRCDLILEDDL